MTEPVIKEAAFHIVARGGRVVETWLEPEPAPSEPCKCDDCKLKRGEQVVKYAGFNVVGESSIGSCQCADCKRKRGEN